MSLRTERARGKLLGRIRRLREKRVDDLPDDFVFGSHLERPAVGHATEKHASVEQALSTEEIGRKEVSWERRRIGLARASRQTRPGQQAHSPFSLTGVTIAMVVEKLLSSSQIEGLSNYELAVGTIRCGSLWETAPSISS